MRCFSCGKKVAESAYGDLVAGKVVCLDCYPKVNICSGCGGAYHTETLRAQAQFCELCS